MQLLMSCSCTSVRWLSKGNILECFGAIRKELQVFLSEQSFAKDCKTGHGIHAKWRKDGSCSIFGWYNISSQQPESQATEQEQQCELISAVHAFQMKLEVFKSDLQVSLFNLFYHTHPLDSNEQLFDASQYPFKQCSLFLFMFYQQEGLLHFPKPLEQTEGEEHHQHHFEFLENSLTYPLHPMGQKAATRLNSWRSWLKMSRLALMLGNYTFGK